MHRKGRKGSVCGGSGPSTVDDTKVTCARCVSQLDTEFAGKLDTFLATLKTVLEIEEDISDEELAIKAGEKFPIEGVEPFAVETPLEIGLESRVPILWVGFRGRDDLQVPGLEALGLVEGVTGSPSVPVFGNPVRQDARFLPVIYGLDPVADIAHIMDRLFSEGWEKVSIVDYPYEELDLPAENLRRLLDWAAPELDKNALRRKVDEDLVAKVELMKDEAEHHGPAFIV